MAERGRLARPPAEAPRYSVVIPTFQRRDQVVAAVTDAGRLEYDRGLEVIVVVDGSTDGTAAALRALSLPVPLRVVEQDNAGRARACNVGAQAAHGEILLFLDDDMRVAPGLLHAHDRAYDGGADAVMGHIPLHPDVPLDFLSRGVAEWAERRAERLSEPGAVLTVADLVTGQFSIPRALFERLGGYDEQFNRGGSFGREDTDFGHRLLEGGHRLVFAPDAVSWQVYRVRPAAYLRQWHQAGRADVTYLRKYPDQFEQIYRSRRPNRRWNRLVFRPLARVPVAARLVAAVCRPAVVALVTRRPDDERARRWFFRMRSLEYWRGVQAAGGFPRAEVRLRVLCYHAVRDLSGAAVLSEYGVPATLLERQLRAVRRAGYRFVTTAEVLRWLDGGGLPRRPVLVTFDDGYVDLATEALPVLDAEGVPAAVFAVSALLGGTNEWDQAIGAPALELLDAKQLAELVPHGIDIGGHGRTHRPLRSLPPDQLEQETHGAVAELVAQGLPTPRVFSYPHGEYDAAACAAVRDAGMEAAFTVRPGLVTRSGAERFALPRIEVFRRDGAGLRFVMTVVLARRPGKRARRLARRVRRYGSRSAPARRLRRLARGATPRPRSRRR
jgi:peptidoglycan/xylan/chitin deacetylase (PgdA/CDA1 family)/glycosyltransferase involved in cell wall biosynthesis